MGHLKNMKQSWNKSYKDLRKQISEQIYANAILVNQKLII
jgi:hypothetical protein